VARQEEGEKMDERYQDDLEDKEKMDSEPCDCELCVCEELLKAQGRWQLADDLPGSY
jgi:hypothetical protein